MWSCSQPTITDAVLAHMDGADDASIAAACDLGLPVTTGDKAALERP